MIIVVFRVLLFGYCGVAFWWVGAYCYLHVDWFVADADVCGYYDFINSVV